MDINDSHSSEEELAQDEKASSTQQDSQKSKSAQAQEFYNSIKKGIKILAKGLGNISVALLKFSEKMDVYGDDQQQSNQQEQHNEENKQEEQLQQNENNSEGENSSSCGDPDEECGEKDSNEQESRSGSEEQEQQQKVEYDLGEIEESDGESMDIGGFIDQEQVLGRKVLSHYWKKQKSINSVVWCKDVKIGMTNGGEFAYEDFFKISRLSGGISRSKISSFRVWALPGNGYICGLQFFYSSLDEPEKIIPGFQSRSKSIWKRERAITEEFHLLPNEYIVEFTGRRGMVIAQFGVKTSLGNHYKHGGSGGGPYSVKAPEGFHFTCFSAQFCPGWDSISQFAAEVIRIPESKENENTQPKQNLGEITIYKPVFRNLIEFLTISEILKLFRLNKTFARFRHDEYVMSKIGMRCVYSGNPKLQKYIQKMIKHYARDIPEYKFDIIRNYIRLSKNLVQNPNGEQKFEGYDISDAQGGSGLNLDSDGTTNYFQFSYVWGRIVWRANLVDIFNTEESIQEKMLQKIQNAEYALVFGASICESGFGSIAKMKVEIFDEAKEKIFSIENTYNELSREFKYYIIKFINPYPERKPHSIAFSLSGKDTCYWKGHYGAKIRNITLKVMPIEDEQEKAYFERYVQ